VISDSSSPSTSIRGGGGWTHPGIMFGVAGSSWETWKIRCMAFMDCSSQRVWECEPGLEMISKGPRNFSESFFDGWVVRKNSALMYT
jgi:hypothetical protein